MPQLQVQMQATLQQQPLKQCIDEAAKTLRKKLRGATPDVLLILGSGLGALAEEVDYAIRVPFAQIPFMQSSTAAGHVGQFVGGTLEGVRVLCMQGRLHGYEGYDAWQVAFPVWVANALGARTLITTNAAGGINEAYQPGDFCVMADHINLTGRNPLVGTEQAQVAPRFVSMTDCYDPALRALALQVACAENITAHAGVYAGLLGPSFETPAEIRALRAVGADTVAMSVCEETIAARHVGMCVLGISLVSNLAAGMGSTDGTGGASPTDEEVHEIGAARAEAFTRLIRGVLRGL